MKKSLTLNFEVIEDRKVKAKSTLIINLLKKFDIPGGRAAMMFHKHGAEYIVKKVFLLEFKIAEEGFKVDSMMRCMQACIVNDWNESEKFNDYNKRRREYIIKNGPDDLRQLLSI